MTRAEQRLLMLSRAMRTFAQATSNVDELLEVVAHDVAHGLGDACVLLELSADGTELVPTAAHAVDPEELARVQDTLESEPFCLEDHPTARELLETHGSRLVPRVAHTAAGSQGTPAYLRFQQELGVHSLLAVALHANGRPLGLLTLARYRPSSPAFDEEDRELATSLAEHAALAIANARLYAAERSARLAAEEAVRAAVAAEVKVARLHAERAMDAMFRAVVEAAPDAIVVVDTAGSITLVNGQAEQLFDYARSEILHRPFDELVADGRGHRGDGSDFPLEVTVSKLATDGGTLCVHAIRDVTARKAAERELLAAKEAAEAAHRELESFSYSVAHDLRAPVRAMTGFGHIVLADHGAALGPEGSRLVARIIENATKMGELVDGLLELSKITRAQPRRERIELSRVVECALAQAIADHGETHPEVVVASGLVTSADPTLIRALVDNLARNAVKFSSRATAPRIEFGQTLDGAFFLADNGAGFDMAHASALFAPFRRLHGANEFPGTGIGLATAHRIIERHGGRIWAEGRVGHGATFFFTLP